jgi:hypothetical protein
VGFYHTARVLYHTVAKQVRLLRVRVRVQNSRPAGYPCQTLTTVAPAATAANANEGRQVRTKVGGRGERERGQANVERDTNKERVREEWGGTNEHDGQQWEQQ